MGMRVTNTMLVRNMTNYISGNLSRMQKFQYMIANGKKIELPSDDPVVASRALKLRTDLAEVEQYKRNVDDAISWMDTTEGTLANIGDVMQRVRELTVEGSSEHLVGDDLKKIGDEMKQLKKQLINVGNTTYAGRYIFSGFGTNKPLLDAEGNFSNNVSESENIKYEIGIGDNININVLGGDIFNSGGEAVGSTKSSITGTDEIDFPLEIVSGSNEINLSVDGETPVTVSITEGTYDSISEFKTTLQGNIDNQIGSGKIYVTDVDEKLKLESNTKGSGSSIEIDVASSTAATILKVDTYDSIEGEDGEKGTLMTLMDDLIDAFEDGENEVIGELLGTIDDEMNNLLRVRADVGARQNRLELTNNRLDNDTVNFTRLMSLNEDIDMAEIIMKLQNEENIYNASLAGGAKIIMPTLVDFLR